jgi:TPP-dependent trihydroxycyclohexane-1,2-dione (THcHDO) dehydratase
VFAGKECARALAIMSTDPADCNGKVADLPNDKKEVLRDWQRKFLGKYRVVGAIEGAAWDTTTRSPTRTFKRPKPSGHNTPIVVAVAGVAVAGAAVALSVLLARS